jgi:CysZ protein
MKSVLGGFGLVAGATYPLQALITFRRNPRLWQYVIVPILLNLAIALVLYGGLLFFGWQVLDEVRTAISLWLDSVLANLPTWLNFLQYIILALAYVLRLLLILGLLIVTGFVLTQFGVLLGSPWYGQLSEQLEKIRTGKIEIIEVGFFSELGRAILYELKKLVLIGGVGLLLLSFNFLPGIGTLGITIGWFVLTATIICLDFFDAPLERRRLRFCSKLGIVFRSLPASGSFSLVCLGLISIPLLNLFTIPLCVASGTLFVCDRILPRIARIRSQ